MSGNQASVLSIEGSLAKNWPQRFWSSLAWQNISCTNGIDMHRQTAYQGGYRPNNGEAPNWVLCPDNTPLQTSTLSSSALSGGMGGALRWPQTLKCQSATHSVVYLMVWNAHHRPTFMNTDYRKRDNSNCSWSARLKNVTGKLKCKILMLPVTLEVQNMPTLPITSVRDALPPIEVGQITLSVIEAKQAASSLVEVEQVTVPFRLICADLVIQIH